jgi:hypothetical protein
MLDGSIDFLEVKVSGGVVAVWHGRSAANVEEGATVLAAIDAALARSGVEVLMFDSRDADRTPPEVQAQIWDWLTRHTGIRKVATLMHSKDLAKMVRVNAVGNGVRLKTFDDEGQARRWLMET